MPRPPKATRRRGDSVRLRVHDRLLLSLYVRFYRELVMHEIRFVAQLSRSVLITPAIVRVANQRVLKQLAKRWE